jgi:hypothetical protein
LACTRRRRHEGAHPYRGPFIRVGACRAAAESQVTAASARGDGRSVWLGFKAGGAGSSGRAWKVALQAVVPLICLASCGSRLCRSAQLAQERSAPFTPRQPASRQQHVSNTLATCLREREKTREGQASVRAAERRCSRAAPRTRSPARCATTEKQLATCARGLLQHHPISVVLRRARDSRS